MLKNQTDEFRRRASEAAVPVEEESSLAALGMEEPSLICLLVLHVRICARPRVHAGARIWMHAARDVLQLNIYKIKASEDGPSWPPSPSSSSSSSCMHVFLHGLR